MPRHDTNCIACAAAAVEVAVDQKMPRRTFKTKSGRIVDGICVMVEKVAAYFGT